MSKQIFTGIFTLSILSLASLAYTLEPGVNVIPMPISMGKHDSLIESLRDAETLKMEFSEETAIHPLTRTISAEEEISLYVQHQILINEGNPQFEAVSFELDILNFTVAPKGDGSFALQLPEFSEPEDYRYVMVLKSEHDANNGAKIYYLRPGSELILRSPKSTLSLQKMENGVANSIRLEASTAFTQDGSGQLWIRFTTSTSADVDFDGDAKDSSPTVDDVGPAGQKPVNGMNANFGQSGGWTCSLQSSSGTLQDMGVLGGFLVLTLAQNLRHRRNRK